MKPPTASLWDSLVLKITCRRNAGNWLGTQHGSCIPIVSAYCFCVTLFFLGERRRGDSRQETILTTDPVVTLQSNKVPVVQPSHAVHPLTPLITYSDEHFSPGSHPSHIPSDVNSKQGKCFRLPRPLSPVKRPCL